MVSAADLFQAKILIVDDLEMNVELLHGMLTGAGYSAVSSTTNSHEVCELHRQNHYSLILLDLEMPGLDGFEVLEGLKKIETDSYPPVLVVTAESEHKLRALKAGARDFLTKPLDMAEVQVRVQNMLEVRLLHLETRKLYQQISAEQKVSEQLLLNVLPAAIAQRLKNKPGVIADNFPDATILFAALHDFPRLTEGLPPEKVVNLLNEIYSGFDALIEGLGLEKIKIMGDAYLVASGLPNPRADHAEAMAEAALGLQQHIARFETSGGEIFSLRIGIDTGPVVAGVIGKTRFSYDLWGETVETAQHMETYGAPGHIQVNARTYDRLKEKYVLESRGQFYVKDKGELKTYFLKGRKIPGRK